jgi:carboxymethylenebutenolidase
MQKDITIPFENQKVSSYYCAPDSDHKFPGIILIHEIWGLNDQIRDVANRLQREGYAVLAPDLFEDTPIKGLLTPALAKEAFDPKTRDQAQPKLRALFAPMQSPEFAKNMLMKLKACFSYLENDPQCNGNIGVSGFCFGGTYSFSLAIEEPKIKAAVPFYGGAPEPFDKIENLRCPVLAFYGEKDERLIGQLPAVKDAMKKYGKDFEAVVYPNTGHAFFNDKNQVMYNKEASDDAWAKMLKFLQTNLS